MPKFGRFVRFSDAYLDKRYARSDGGKKPVVPSKTRRGRVETTKKKRRINMARVYGSRRDVGSVTDVCSPATGRYQTDHCAALRSAFAGARARTARRVGRAPHDVISAAPAVSSLPAVTPLPFARAYRHTPLRRLCIDQPMRGTHTDGRGARGGERKKGKK